MRWGSSAVAACRVVEGLADKVMLVSWRADMALSKLILSKNQLLWHDNQLQIDLCQELLAGVRLWGGPRLRDSIDIIIFRNKR